MAEGANGADDRGDGDGGDRAGVTEGVSFVLGARANGPPLPPSASGSRGSRPKMLGGSDARATQKGKRNTRILASLIFSSPVVRVEWSIEDIQGRLPRPFLCLDST